MGQVGDMGVKVAVGPGTGLIFLQSPDQGKFRVHYPVLKISSPVVIDSAELA